MSAIGVCLCDCTAGNKTSRFPIQINIINGKTERLFSEIAKKVSANENELEIFYCGQKLEKNMSLENFSLTSQSTLFVFRRMSQAQASKGVPPLQRASEMIPVIHRAVQHPSYRKVVDQILTSKDSLQRLITAVPGLDKDPMTIAMLQDPELLQILAHRVNIHNVLKKHPLFGPAAMHVANIVNQEAANDPTRPARSNVYSMDQMSDDEDEGNQRGAVGGTPQQHITASQLAAALAAATASAPAPRPSTSSTSAAAAPSTSSGSGGTTPVISPDFFHQAMMTAQSHSLETQLQQLRDMGITDENVARQALAASGGNLQGALEFIFGDSGM